MKTCEHFTQSLKPIKEKVASLVRDRYKNIDTHPSTVEEFLDALS